MGAKGLKSGMRLAHQVLSQLNNIPRLALFDCLVVCLRQDLTV